MAKEEVAGKADAAAAPKRKGKKLLIIIMVLVLVVVLAGAGVVGLLLMKKKGDTDGEDAANTPAASSGVDLTRPPTFVNLDPFVVNLSPEEGDRYLQVVMALRVQDVKTGDNLKNFMPEIRHRINLRLSSKVPSQVSNPEGRETLASEIAEDINTVLGAQAGSGTGPIQAVLFNSFIVQ